MKENRAMNNDDFYGFLEELDEATAEQITEHLLSSAVAPIYDGDTKGQVVEEIIFRGGNLYTGAEAKEAVPWVVKNDTKICAASFPYREGETRKKAQGYEEHDWRVLDDIQYMYGKHLLQLVAEGKLSIHQD